MIAGDASYATHVLRVGSSQTYYRPGRDGFAHAYCGNEEWIRTGYKNGELYYQPCFFKLEKPITQKKWEKENYR